MNEAPKPQWRTEREGDPGACARCGKIVKNLDEHWRGACPETSKARCGWCPEWRPWFEELWQADEAAKEHAERCWRRRKGYHS